MLLIAPISTRSHFGKLLNSRGLEKLAVEVGTHRGEFAAEFLEIWKGKMLYCVDPWNVPDDYAEQILTLPDRGPTREDDFEKAKSRLAPFRGRYKLLRTVSKEAAKVFEDGSIDFVFLDANHRYESVLEDLNIWWPKVTEGGVLAGHDYICPGEKDGGWGRNIQAAVAEFLKSHERDVFLVVEREWSPWSFYFVK